MTVLESSSTRRSCALPLPDSTGTISSQLTERINFLQSQLANAPQSANQRFVFLLNQKFWSRRSTRFRVERVKCLTAATLMLVHSYSQKQLLCLEDAWNQPISQEFESRQKSANQGRSLVTHLLSLHWSQVPHFNRLSNDHRQPSL